MYIPDGTRRKTSRRPNPAKQSLPVEIPHHPFEDRLQLPWVRKIVKILMEGANGRTPFEEICASYRNPQADFWKRLKYGWIHKIIDRYIAKAGLDAEFMCRKLFHHTPTVRALVNTGRSLAAYGLTAPQRFVAPLMVVWNITNVCNLSCRHCYQDAVHGRSEEELSRAEKLEIVDQLSENYVPLLAIAGGEPLLDPDLVPVLERAREKQIYCTVATNGTLLTPANCVRLAGAGLKYIEVSLDSPAPETHDEFRQTPGAWSRSVEGVGNAIRAGLECGIATCFTRDTVERAQEMIDFARSIGASRFVHFNFIPTGRGSVMAHEDLDPDQRERLLKLLHENLVREDINILSTAPQFSRTCLMAGTLESRTAMGHAGSAPGYQAHVLSKYLGGCGAHRCYCCIQPNGLTTPCVYIPGEILGDLRKTSFREIWDTPLGAVMGDRDDRGEHCGVCDFRAYCGGCRARAKSYTGDLQAGDPGCIYNRPMWDEITDEKSARRDSIPSARRRSKGERPADSPPPAC